MSVEPKRHFGSFTGLIYVRILSALFRVGTLLPGKHVGTDELGNKYYVNENRMFGKETEQSFSWSFQFIQFWIFGVVFQVDLSNFRTASICYVQRLLDIWWQPSCSRMVDSPFIQIISRNRHRWLHCMTDEIPTPDSIRKQVSEHEVMLTIAMANRPCSKPYRFPGFFRFSFQSSHSASLCAIQHNQVQDPVLEPNGNKIRQSRHSHTSRSINHP